MTRRLRIAAGLLLLALSGCDGNLLRQQGAGDEIVLLPLPEGYVMLRRSEGPGTYLAVYGPPGDTLAERSETLSILSAIRRAAPDRKTLIAREQANARSDCAVPALVSAPVDAGPASAFTVRCGNRARATRAEAAYVKVIEGQGSWFVLNFTWRFPAVDASDKVPLTTGMRSLAETTLGPAKACDPREGSNRPCVLGPPASP